MLLSYIFLNFFFTSSSVTSIQMNETELLNFLYSLIDFLIIYSCFNMST